MTPAPYPHGPGSKERGGASQDAATSISGRAVALRDGVISTLSLRGPLTADECAAIMGESVLSIRPRFTELGALGKIEKTTFRRPNASGHNAAVWRLSPEQAADPFPGRPSGAVFAEIGRRVAEAAA